MQIPADMVNQEASEELGGTVVSVRDMLVLLGATDEELREQDRISQLRKDILVREPWRDKTRKRNVGVMNGREMFVIEGIVGWSGTEMQQITESQLAKERSKPRIMGRKHDWYWVWEVQEWDGEKWTVTKHDDTCECPECCNS